MDGCTRSGTSKSSNASLIRRVFSQFLNGVDLNELRRHGNSRWDPRLLIMQVILWRMSGERTLMNAFEDGKKNCLQLFGAVASQSYQAMMGALLTYTPQLLNRMQRQLRVKIESDPDSRIAGYFAVAVDGSKPSAPRTQSNEDRFVSKNYGKGKGAKSRRKKRERQGKKLSGNSQPTPNVLLTKWWNIALQIPWHWTFGDAETDERTEAAKCLENVDFPAETLIVADAGFVGFQLWQQIINANLTFLIRVGANVHLMPKSERKGIYYYWPKRSQKRPPIIVRLVYIKIGNTKMAMVTNELDSARLSKSTIRTLYELRWGVEVDFRDFKQAFDCKKFRCKKADRVMVEANWSMFAFTLIKLWTSHHQKNKHGDRNRTSFALALQAWRRALANHNNVDQPEIALSKELKGAIRDNYKRNNKTARYKPSGEKPGTGLPVIHTITKEQRAKIEKALRIAV